MNNTSSLVFWTDLYDFNTRLELLFLEVLNHPRSTQFTTRAHNPACAHRLDYAHVGLFMCAHELARKP